MSLPLFSNAEKDATITFPTDYESILDRIHNIDPIQYSKTRNYLNGSVCYLSPYISRGVISVKQIMDTVLQKGYTTYQSEKFLQELAWREYFQRVWQHIGDAIWVDIKQPQPDTLHDQMIESVKNAVTGIEAIDQGIKHLYISGYMHNHMRMYIASMVCNLAKAHWKQPSKWMYYHLLDGDIASNNCGWQWVAAAFASKKYYFNQENLNKYTFSKQQHSFLDKSYEEIIAMDIPENLRATSSLILQTTLPNTPLPKIDSSIPTLIYNSYNLDMEWYKGENVNRVLLLEPSHFKKYPVSQKVLQFILALSKNIDGIQIYSGEISYIIDSYPNSAMASNYIISKEHPTANHFPGVKISRQWMFPEVSSYHPSYFSFWKKCEMHLG